ncbi:MAG TPA: maltose alpha-D-glucosyltransferase [Chitinophagaceae bacterium]
MAKSTTALDDKLHWYKDAIIYELHIKAFKDSSGDGIGDFGGLLEKLDYLQELGVTAIWLLPFYPSPLKDDGYDIADYYSINPSYGTIEQFKQLLEEAHKRNLKVITELVINHTSDQHPWFQRARRAPIGSPERDFYVWSDDPNKYKDVRIIFQDFEGSNWTWDPVAQQYYWHRFFHHQPDLNYDSPLVQEEVFKVLDYWCAMGVDGFRLDAVPYLFEREGTNGENLPETHAFLKKLRKHLDDNFPGTLFLAEANMWPEDSAAYFGEGDECHMNYHFPAMPRMFMALQMEDRYPITDIFDQTPDIPETCQWAMFLRNHDELTLEMVTDEERDYMYKVYAKDPKARINLGIRHRLAPLLDNNRRKIELLNSLLFSLPGTPVVYYGDEIGMGDNFYLGDRDGVRTPMQWSPDRNAGFSITNPQKLYLPVIMDPEYHYESVNVETQRSNTSSLFWFMKRIINIRKRYKAFSRGDMKFLNVDNPKVLAFTRTYQEQVLLIVVNLSKYSQPAEIDLIDFKGYVPVEVFSKNRFPAIKEDSSYFFTLSPHSYQWFELQKAHVGVDERSALPQLQADKWEDLLTPALRQQLESEVLPHYLASARWFMGRERKVHTVNIMEQAPIQLPEGACSIWLLEVIYESGLPELYQLPVLFGSRKLPKYLAETCPQSIIANLALGGVEGVLCDALYINPYQQWVLDRLAANDRIKTNGGTLEFRAHEEVTAYSQGGEDGRSRIHQDGVHTSVAYDSAFYLKAYRKVDRGSNPDVELSQMLSDHVHFPYVPKFLGSIEWNTGNETIVLGLMQELVENHGDGYTYMRERMHNYFDRIMARSPQELEQMAYYGTLTHPVGYEELPEPLKLILGARGADHAQLMGTRTAQLHLALASGTTKDFAPEEFSLHYQRSLFSSMQAQVRETLQKVGQHLNNLPSPARPLAEDLLGRRSELLNLFKRIYSKKLNIIKTRIHGNYNLGQVLLTGRDVAIKDFSGNSFRPFSERRLKRSPLRDVAGMVRSFYFAAYDGLFQNHDIPAERIPSLIPYVDLWAHYASMFFMKAYLEAVRGSKLVPEDGDDFEVVLQIYLLERGLKDLYYEVAERPRRAIVSLRIIQSILQGPDVPGAVPETEAINAVRAGSMDAR